MSSSENLLKAALNRISVRLSNRLFNTATNLSQKAKDTPEQIKAEWELLKQEILEEAERLENDSENSSSADFKPQQSHEKIKSLRSKISLLIDKVEDKN